MLTEVLGAFPVSWDAGVLVFGRDRQEHYGLPEKKGHFLQKKCKIAKDHKASTKCTEADKVKGILQMPEPTSMTDVHCLIGMGLVTVP